jgi:transposase
LDKEWFRRKYVDEQLSCKDIAKLIGCSKMTVSRLLKKVGIRARGFINPGKKHRMTKAEALEILSDDFCSDLDELLEDALGGLARL